MKVYNYIIYPNGFPTIFLKKLLTKVMYNCIIVYNYTKPSLRKGVNDMLEISKKTNLLEQKSYKYSLQDIPEPNLYRDVYSYSEVPKVAFNHRRTPMNMPEKIWITDS